MAASAEPVEREQLEADVLIVGGGPAGLSCAIHLARLIEQHNKQNSEQGGSPKLSSEDIYVVEKAEELGLHSLSGAVMDPRGLAELIPDFEKAGAPLDSKVGDDAAYFLTESRAFRAPITPPPLRNHGNYVISLSKLTKWLGERAEAAGVNVFTGFAGAGLLFDGDTVVGVRTDDKGIGKDGARKANFQAGYELRAKVTVLAEGTRGSLSKELISRCHLDAGRNPTVYSVGVKELWEVPEGRIKPGTVWHTMGYPLGSDMYGGGWVYGMQNNRVSIGLVAGLHYANPFFDSQIALQKYKQHPFVRKILEGGKLIRYGAKSMPAGGYWTMPRAAIGRCRGRTRTERC